MPLIGSPLLNSTSASTGVRSFSFLLAFVRQYRQTVIRVLEFQG